MGIEGIDGLLLLFVVIACAARGHLWVRFPNFVCPLQKDKCVPSTFLDAASKALAWLQFVCGTQMEALDGY